MSANPEEVQANKDRTTYWFEHVWNHRKENVIDELTHEDVRGYGFGAEPINREGFRAAWYAFLDALPDLRVEVGEVIGEGNATATRITVEGTHQGHGFGVPPCGAKLKFDAQVFVHWKDGKIIEAWNVIDMASVFQQIKSANP